MYPCEMLSIPVVTGYERGRGDAYNKPKLAGVVGCGIRGAMSKYFQVFLPTTTTLSVSGMFNQKQERQQNLWGVKLQVSRLRLKF